MQVSGYTCDDIASSHKALSDPTRIRILAILLDLGELCGCDIEAALGITQSKASRHLGILKQAGFVGDRRDGTWVYFRLARHPDPLTSALLKTLRASLSGNSGSQDDVKRARSMRRSPCGQPPKPATRARRGAKR